MEAYIYIRRIERNEPVLENVRAIGYPPVRFVSPLAGPYVAFAAVDVADVQAAQDLITNEFLQAGVLAAELSFGLRSATALWPKHRSPPVAALIQIKVAPGSAEDVLAQLPELDTFVAAAIVSGNYDILLELGGEDVASMEPDMFHLHRTPGVVRSDTSFVRVVDSFYAQEYRPRSE